jgi:hypothetical protein
LSFCVLQYLSNLVFSLKTGVFGVKRKI